MKDLQNRIDQLMREYVAVISESATEGENDAVHFLMKTIGEMDYFAKHPENCGAYAIPGDGLNRSVFWAMVTGHSPDTVVLIHHYDVVGVEDFKLLKHLAYSPDALEKALLDMRKSLMPEAREDLLSGRYIFGKGTADMKAGGAIQFALLEHYGALPDLRGNVLVIAVPDEENLSAGMRGAAGFLAKLAEERGLRYRLLINSEPHQRKQPEIGVFSEGSVGKLMPFAYVRGCMSHAGKVFEGLNPANVAAEIARRMELCLDFTDVVGNETSPPPTCLYMKDGKAHYDVSMPLDTCLYFSVLTLTSGIDETMDKFRAVCEKAASDIVFEMERAWRQYNELAGRAFKPLGWRVSVTDIAGLVAMAEKSHGAAFTQSFEQARAELAAQANAGKLSTWECNYKLIETVYGYIDDLTPTIVYGLLPPYYPSVSNLNFPNDPVSGLYTHLNQYSEGAFGQAYAREYYFTGISDLSYTYITDSAAKRESLRRFMPLFEHTYDIPLADIEKISMPVINIGPWGKDFHKLTERVLKEDMLVRTPRLIDEAIQYIFEHKRL